MAGSLLDDAIKPHLLVPGLRVVPPTLTEGCLHSESVGCLSLVCKGLYNLRLVSGSLTLGEARCQVVRMLKQLFGELRPADNSQHGLATHRRESPQKRVL